MTDPYPIEITVQELQALRDSAGDSGEKLTILDIREATEVEICTIEGSLHIPMNNIPDNLDKLPGEGFLVVYCHSGGRSAMVSAWLRDNEINNAVNLTGGIHAWACEIETDMSQY